MIMGIMDFPEINGFPPNNTQMYGHARESVGFINH